MRASGEFVLGTSLPSSKKRVGSENAGTKWHPYDGNRTSLYFTAQPHVYALPFSVCMQLWRISIYIYIYFMEPSQTRGSELQCSLLIACTCYHALYKRADTAEVTYCWVGPCLSIYDIFLSVHSITTCHNSLKLRTEAPPPALNTLQHNSPLLKIDPCEVTHSGKHTARRGEQCSERTRGGLQH